MLMAFNLFLKNIGIYLQTHELFFFSFFLSIIYVSGYQSRQTLFKQFNAEQQTEKKISLNENLLYSPFQTHPTTSARRQTVRSY